jgi:gas vesicle protein
MRLLIILTAAATLAGAQQAGKELKVPQSPAEVTLEKTAADIREQQKLINDAMQQSNWELDKQNKPILAQIQKLQDRMRDNQNRFQQRFNKVAEEKMKQSTIYKAQLEYLAYLVKKSAGLPESAEFDIETGKWKISSK